MRESFGAAGCNTVDLCSWGSCCAYKTAVSHGAYDNNKAKDPLQ